ncbi:hypothetical protein [Pseudomonas sp. CGJS7]|uniref:hypothetical protein n=1 Tax=Pseudomonas sp. CGJS7 TaxID=3109348 RepID=UPI00300A865A
MPASQIDEQPPRTIVFQVGEVMFRSVGIGDAVRIAYVPQSKIIVQLSTASYEYSICDDLAQGQSA